MSGSKLTPSGRGLSPQVRGNLIEAPGVQRQLGSIPAGAGEPRLCRAHGVDDGSIPAGAGEPGRPPQVRGNRVVALHDLVTDGSIPAGAGEPRLAPAKARPSWVYPRRCGGTGSVGASSGTVAGLSPQVRGNPLIHCSVSWAAGSIPAGAGEPASRTGSPCRSWVYPRRCGGTGFLLLGPGAALGLSPQVRGNRPDPDRHVDCVGSIPAGAGEPRPRRLPRAGPRVYPRRCGGTSPGPAARCAGPGLSPQVRGNRRFRRARRDGPGSIPAGAGEPLAILADSPGRVEALPRPLEAAAWCFVSDVKERASPRVHDLLTSRTPSASQMFFGGSPR